MTNLSPNALNLLKQRYFKSGEDWNALVDRVTNAVCNKAVGTKKEEIRKLIYDRVFLPNSPCLFNAGTKAGGYLACFTLGPSQDTLEDAFETIKDLALVAKRGGGCGFTGTILRPKNSLVAGSSHWKAFGPNAFSKVVSQAMDTLTQSGARKMALMYTLSSDHPDAEEFIYLKQTSNEADLYNFNQSLMASDSWMNRALTNVGGEEAHLFHKICEHSWRNGEPGLLFEDTINTNTPYKYSNQHIYTSNPCGEVPMPPFGSCNLSSINLNHEIFNKLGSFDFEKLAEVTKLAICFMDDVGTTNTFPNAKFEKWYEENRALGLGFKGLADLFLRYEIAYGSEESLQLLDSICKTMYESAHEQSVLLGELLGIPEKCKVLPEPRRNITVMSIAPTGSIAMIADTSHGIEPVFSPNYERIDERGEKYIYKHPLADKEYFVSAIGEKQPTWKEQIDLVATAQKWVDSGISKTINLPNDATVSDVKEAMIYAWKSKCKGITLYRDASRSFQVLNQVPTSKDVENANCKDGACSL